MQRLPTRDTSNLYEVSGLLQQDNNTPLFIKWHISTYILLDSYNEWYTIYLYYRSHFILGIKNINIDDFIAY